MSFYFFRFMSFKSNLVYVVSTCLLNKFFFSFVAKYDATIRDRLHIAYDNNHRPMFIQVLKRLYVTNAVNVMYRNYRNMKKEQVQQLIDDVTQTGKYFPLFVSPADNPANVQHELMTMEVTLSTLQDSDACIPIRSD